MKYWKRSFSYKVKQNISEKFVLINFTKIPNGGLMATGLVGDLGLVSRLTLVCVVR